MAIKWYQQMWVVVIVNILFLPAGILLILMNSRWPSSKKFMWIVLFSAIYIAMYYLTTHGNFISHNP
ncbi:hypothetical protein E0485_17665 [Paenibacillus albiflavus]|uniref:Uncharacterized protein n=1 Tax=Paenibacillus albiflavus TaxID=2545760 RepID=A0A4R4EBW9_9BACL|nr:hypothetical protein [Paenibacillus albiflavus]TCZ75428.1 hypothetical protein E0485_17665 [Paenibacillus albiflavus]